MDPAELDIGGAPAAPRARPRKAVLEALERLLRAQIALSGHREPEGAYGLLRPARDEEMVLIEAVFLHGGVPLPDPLRAVYQRTLGVGNPVSDLPVLSVPFLRAALPDEGFGPPIVGLEAFESELGLHPQEDAQDRPPFLYIGHAAPLGLTVSRNGLWSLQDYQGGRAHPEAQDFNLVFEAAFCTFVEQVLLVWANDLAGDIVKRQDLDVLQGARLATMPASLQEAWNHLLAPRSLGPKGWGDVQPLDSPDLLRATRRSHDAGSEDRPASHVTIVGLPYGERPDLADLIGPGALLRPRPVDDNPHDPFAVEVWHDGRQPLRIGFVARREAPAIRNLPEGPDSWRLRVVGRSDHVLFAMIERTRASDRPAEDQNGQTASDGEPDLFSHGT
ncbi:hypothetical protein [Rubellimicrobium arenae]|uniref:hypothetical protein n=1 Tax=Rubellimicrobium arenae TaxID=2817372 RepID=UPI001B311E81|nr:hypothetical protein [Rubellimicrobium arenae]